MRVLVVEDSKDVAVSVVAFLVLRGHEQVVVAESVPAARRALETEEWDAVLTDFQLPGGDGLDVVEAVLALGEGRPRVILWSGLDRSSDAARRGVAPDAIRTKDRMPEVLDELVRGG